MEAVSRSIFQFRYLVFSGRYYYLHYFNLHRSLWMDAPEPVDEEEDWTANHGNEAFYRVISDMVISGLQEGHPYDSILMEIKGFKFSQNKVFFSF